MLTCCRSRERGVALLLVLWVFMLLGVLALDFSRYMRDDAMAAINYADETRGYYVALAGMNRALYERARALAESAGAAAAQKLNGQQPVPTTLDDQPQPLVPPDGEWHEGDFAGARWSVRMRDEGGLVPLNAIAVDAHEAFLRWIVKNLVRGGNATTGVDRRAQKTIDTVVDSILDWRDREKKPITRANGAESDYYLKQRVPYYAKDGPLESPEELLKIRGVTPALYYGTDGNPGLRDVFSVRLGRYDNENLRRVNLRSAPPAVLQVPVGDPDTAASLLEQRDTGVQILPLGQNLLQTNPGRPSRDGAQYVADYEPEVLMVEARADVTRERNQSRIAALVDLSKDVTILQWFDRAPWDGTLPGLPATVEGEG